MKIKIPKPCHEDWEKMFTDEHGKFCSVCSKSVRDFTNCTDAEVNDIVSINDNICGRFLSSQLNKELTGGFVKLCSTLLLSSVIFTSMSAQNSNPKVIFNPTECKEDTAKVVQVIVGGISSIPSGLPLYIIDGKFRTATDFRNIKDEDINTAKILRHPESTEKYGKKAKNGVILITTKKKKKKK